MKKASRSTKIKRIVVTIVVLGAMVFYPSMYYRAINDLSNNGVYTVGEVTGIRTGTRGWEYLQYIYEVDGVTHKGEYGYVTNARIGNKYLVLYSSNRVWLTVIYPNIPMDRFELGFVAGNYNDLKLPIKWSEMPYIIAGPPD